MKKGLLPMKLTLCALTIATLCSTTSLLVMAEKLNIKVVNDIGVTTPVTVSFGQGSYPPTKKFYRSHQFTCVPGGPQDEVTVTADAKINNLEKSKTEKYSCAALKNHVIHINKNEDGITIEPVKQKVVAPKKQKIRGYKPDKDDHKEDWTVTILDDKGGQIATSTFKENTDYRAKNLYLQLNQPAVDPDDEREKYNANKIVVSSKVRAFLPDLTITSDSFLANKFTPGSSMEITKNSIDIVNKSGTLLKQSPREHNQGRRNSDSQAFIEVEEVLPT